MDWDKPFFAVSFPGENARGKVSLYVSVVLSGKRFLQPGEYDFFAGDDDPRQYAL